MTRMKIAAAAALVIFASPAFAAENGTTLAGPAQGTKSDGSSSMRPAGQDGATAAGMTRDSSTAGGAATGTMSGGSTATGGNPGGPAGRN